MIGLRKTARGYLYISLEQPYSDDYTRLIQEAKAPLVEDGVHSSLFYLRPNVSPKAVNPVVEFIQRAVQSQSFMATALASQMFDNSVFGYRIDVDPASKKELLKAAAVFARAKLIDTPALGDSIDRQNNNLHMGIFAPIREDAMYKRVAAALNKYIGMNFKFGNVLFEKQAMKKISLSKTNVTEFRQALASWSDDELVNNFFSGLYDEGTDEFGNHISAADLILDEWMMRSGCYDDIKSMNLIAHSDGDDDRVAYNNNLHRVASARIASGADDSALYR